MLAILGPRDSEALKTTWRKSFSRSLAVKPNSSSKCYELKKEKG